MRTIHYHVINKDTNKSIYVNCDRAKCEKYLNSLKNKEQYAIGYKWLSI